jgi:hypothetical protein
MAKVAVCSYPNSIEGIIEVCPGDLLVVVENDSAKGELRLVTDSGVFDFYGNLQWGFISKSKRVPGGKYQKLPKGTRVTLEQE